VSRGQLNAVSNMSGTSSSHAAPQPSAAPQQVQASEPATDIKFCSIDNPDCEACQ
jgi:ribonucleoside-diphosphate reductase alpha chain